MLTNKEFKQLLIENFGEHIVLGQKSVIFLYEDPTPQFHSIHSVKLIWNSKKSTLKVLSDTNVNFITKRLNSDEIIDLVESYFDDMSFGFKALEKYGMAFEDGELIPK